jgi:hypothetical protein
VQVPAVRIVTVLLGPTLHTDVVVLDRLTGKPEVEEAVSANVPSPRVGGAVGCWRVIVWVPVMMRGAPVTAVIVCPLTTVCTWMEKAAFVPAL